MKKNIFGIILIQIRTIFDVKTKKRKNIEHFSTVLFWVKWNIISTETNTNEHLEFNV